ncbi:MAG: PAS domain S-box protein [Phycisphaerales bacterium]|nr:MAG: PAS domain S-box protein [Phycisphaerales bacterium]
MWDLKKGESRGPRETDASEMGDRRPGRLTRGASVSNETDRVPWGDQDLLETILDSTADGILVTDNAGHVVRTNCRFTELWHIPDALLEMRDDWKLVDYVRDQLEDPGPFLSKVRRLYGTAEEDYEILRFKDGRFFERYSRALIRAGKVWGRVWSFRDVTERKKAEKALRRSEERFRGVFENTLVGLYRTTPDGRILMANPALVRMMGYPSFEELSQLNAEDSFSEGQKRSTFKDRIERDGQVMGMESAWRKRDGSTLFVRESARAIRDEHGETLYYEGTVEDVTERKRAEEMLRLMQFSIDHSSDAAFWMTPDARFVYVNEAACRSLNYSREQLLSMSVHDIDPDFPPEVWPEHWRQVKERGSFSLESHHRTRDGRMFPVEIAVNYVEFEGKEYNCAFARDISERKMVERKLMEDGAQLKSLASQLSLVEERERRRLASELHDQISQSLVIAKIKLDELRQSVSGAKIKKDLDEVSGSLGQTIANTRTLTFDLSSPILYELGFESAVAEWLTERIEKKHGIKATFEDDGQSKPLDEDIRVLLFRNVRELLINVVKHASADRVDVRISRPDDHIRVVVEDDGVGFDPVQAASASAKKDAFGLFSIRQRLEKLGGQLEIETGRGRGCRITMTAPLKHESVSDEGRT